MPEPVLIVAIFAVFLLAGTVKGIIGFGLPSVSMGLLLVVFPLPEAIALMLVPSIFTNIWQAIRGGHAREVLASIWPYLLVANLTVAIGAMALTRIDLAYLSALLGVLMIFYALLCLVRLQITISRKYRFSAGLLIGLLNGIVTGMTGSYVIPGVIYLQGIGLTKDRLIQGMGMLFCSLTISLMIAMSGNNLLTLNLGVLSAFAVVPTFVGMMIGQIIRKGLSEELFRKVFLIALLMLGCYIFFNAIMS